MSNWQALANLESQIQECPINIVLATIEAETEGQNKTGDNGQALGYGQVWPKWHMNNFIASGKELDLNVPSDLPSLTRLVLSNDRYSMSVAVRTIKAYWNSSNGDWSSFTRSYVGAGISDSDFNRRAAIWAKYSGQQTAVLGAFYDSSDMQNQQLIGSTDLMVDKNKIKIGNILYGRRYRVLAGINGNKAIDVSQLRCTFNVTKTILMQPNYSEVTIYNLSPETENSIIKEGYRIVIEAGYEGQQYGLIFDGDVIQPIRDKEDGVTYKLTLRSLDSDRFMNFGFVNTSLGRGMTSRDQIKNCTNKAKVPAELGSISDNLKKSKLTRGKVLFGLSSDYLRQISQSENATYYMEDGKVNIVKANDLPKGEIIELSPASGLIGTPSQTEFGMTARCLLNPRIKVNSYIHINNSLIREREFNIGEIRRSLDSEGIYRVIKVTHIGDTRGDDWYTEVETITQAGYLPGMLASDSMSMW